MGKWTANGHPLSGAALQMERDVHRADVASPGDEPSAAIRAGQHRRIVDAITYHCRLSLFFKSTNHLLFSFWENSCDYLVYTSLCTNRTGCALIIASQHNNTYTHILKLTDGLRAILLDCISHSNDSQKLLILRE
mgnify:CR=1 FL=1